MMMATVFRPVPGVRAASLTTSSVISGGWDQESVKVEGYQSGPDENMSPNAAVVSPSYFATMGIPFVAGRDFTSQDTALRPKVVIINETMAHYFFGSKDPLGKKIGTDDDPKVPPDREIIGVVKDAKYVRLFEAPRRHFYASMAQEERLFDMTLQVRTSDDPEKIGDLVRSQVHDLDANLPLYATTLWKSKLTIPSRKSGFSPGSPACSDYSPLCWHRSDFPALWLSLSPVTRGKSESAWRWARSRATFCAAL
jgi:hypothetical protein